MNFALKPGTDNVSPSYLVLDGAVGISVQAGTGTRSWGGPESLELVWGTLGSSPLLLQRPSFFGCLPLCPSLLHLRFCFLVLSSPFYHQSLPLFTSCLPTEPHFLKFHDLSSPLGSPMSWLLTSHSSPPPPPASPFLLCLPCLLPSEPHSLLLTPKSTGPRPAVLSGYSQDTSLLCNDITAGLHTQEPPSCFCCSQCSGEPRITGFQGCLQESPETPGQS